MGYRSGTTQAAADSLEVRMFGRGAHASMPESSVDPVVMAAMTVLRLQTIVSREIKRIVNAPAAASGAPKPPEIKTTEHYPLTTNDPEQTRRVAAVLRGRFGDDRVQELATPISASEDFGYAFARPSMTRQKLRAFELATGAKPQRGRQHAAGPLRNPKVRAAERAVSEQAEIAYRRMVTDWRQQPKKKGAGATRERASRGPSSGQAARQGSAPEPAL